MSDMPDPHSTSPEVRITEMQRIGTLVAMAIVLGFSLNFGGAASLGPGRWRIVQVVLLAIWMSGIVSQVLALFIALGLPPVKAKTHRVALFVFYAGVSLVLFEFLLHAALNIFGDLAGL